MRRLFYFDIEKGRWLDENYCSTGVTSDENIAIHKHFKNKYGLDGEFGDPVI
jgi:hypothetical protein